MWSDLRIWLKTPDGKCQARYSLILLAEWLWAGTQQSLGQMNYDLNGLIIYSGGFGEVTYENCL